MAMTNTSVLYPPDILTRIDDLRRGTGMSRSDYLRSIAEEHLRKQQSPGGQYAAQTPQAGACYRIEGHGSIVVLSNARYNQTHTSAMVCPLHEHSSERETGTLHYPGIRHLPVNSLKMPLGYVDPPALADARRRLTDGLRSA